MKINMQKIDKGKMLTFKNRLVSKSKDLMKQAVNRLKRHRQFSIAAAVLIGGILVTIIMIALKSEPKKVEYPQLAPLVKTAVIEPQDIEMIIKGYGTVKPKLYVQIVPQVSGRVVSVNPQFRAGGMIPAGEELFRIEPKDFELAVEQAQANVAEMEVKLDIEKSEATVARKEWEQINPGTEPNSALVLREPQIKQAQAQLDSAKAILSKAKLDLERTSIVLPIEVCVTEKKIDLGQYVVSGQAAGSAYGVEAVEIEVPLEDDELAWFSFPDTRAQVKATFAGAEKIFNGVVKRTTGRVDEASRLIYAVVEVVNDPRHSAPNGNLIPGMFVEVNIKGKVLENAFAVKRDWVHNSEEVWVVNGDKLHIRKPKIVRSDEEYAYLTGLSNESIRVITSGLDAVVDGMNVKVIPEKNE